MYLGQTPEHHVGIIDRCGRRFSDGLHVVQVRARGDGIDTCRSWLKRRRELHLPSKGTDQRAVVVAAGPASCGGGAGPAEVCGLV